MSRPSSLVLIPLYARESGPKLRMRLTPKSNGVEALIRFMLRETRSSKLASVQPTAQERLENSTTNEQCAAKPQFAN